MHRSTFRMLLRIINRDERLIIAVLRGVMGLGFLVCGFLQLRAIPYWVNGHTVLATVASSPVVKKSKMHSSSTFRVKFVDSQGVQQNSPIYTRKISYRLGEQLSIRYVRSDPARCTTEGDLWYELPKLLFVLAGTMFLAFCARDISESYLDMRAQMRRSIDAASTA